MDKHYAVVYFNPDELNPTIMYAATTIDGAASYMMTLCEPCDDEDTELSYLQLVDLDCSGYSEEYDGEQADAAVTYCVSDHYYCKDVKEGYYYINKDYNIIASQSYDRELLEESLGL